MHEAARGDAAGATFDDACASKAKHRFGLREECGKVDSLSRTARQSYLSCARPRNHPGQITGRYIAIKEAVQKAWVGCIEALDLDFDTHQKMDIAAEPEVSCYG